MTLSLPNDFIRIPFNGQSGQAQFDISCALNGIEWPPPEELTILGHRYRRIRMSQLTDEEARGMDMIARGAEYEEV